MGSAASIMSSFIVGSVELCFHLLLHRRLLLLLPMTAQQTQVQVSMGFGQGDQEPSGCMNSNCFVSVFWINLCIWSTDIRTFWGYWYMVNFWQVPIKGSTIPILTLLTIYLHFHVCEPVLPTLPILGKLHLARVKRLIDIFQILIGRACMSIRIS